MNKRPILLIIIIIILQGVTVLACWALCTSRMQEGVYFEGHATNFPICAGKIKGRPVCQVSIANITNDSNFLDGRQIQISGYLAIDGSMLAIYSSDHDYLLKNNNNSLRVRAPESKQEDLFLNHGYGYVKLLGRYTVNDRDAIKVGRAGSIFLIDYEPVKLRDKKQEWGDVRFDVQDLE